MFPGFIELKKYIDQSQDPTFDDFVSNNFEDMAIWSSTGNLVSPEQLFGMWKLRYLKCFPSVKGLGQSIRMTDRTVWIGIQNKAQQLRISEDSYAVQALRILERLSSVSSDLIVRAHQQRNRQLRDHASEGLDQQTPEQLTEQSLARPSEIEPTQNQQQAQEQPGEHDSSAEIQRLTIPPPSVTDRYLVQGTDVSVSFYAFQLAAKDNFEHLFLESHVPHILALSSIFMIQNNRWHPDITSIFGRPILQAIYEDRQEKYQIGRFKKELFNRDTREKILDITNEVKDNETISRLPSTITILSLALAGSASEMKIMKCVAKLMDSLPRIPLADDICEFELCHRFLSPVFSALFDDPDKNVLFRWTSITNREAKAETEGQGIISKKRPDAMVSELDGVYFDRTLGFVEVKCSRESRNKHATAKDQIRLGLLSKNALDTYKSKGCLSIQVIGSDITFFIQSIDADGLYAMTELLHFQIPTSLQTLPAFTTYFDDLLAILTCFNNHCLAEETQPNPTRKRPTLSDGEFDEISSRTKSSKRRSYTLH